RSEELSRPRASTGVIMSVNNSLVCDPILKFGSVEQKKAWLLPLARGPRLGCYALSEPEAGSDAANQRTRARRDGAGWVVSGTKNFITNGPNADVVVLFANSDPDKAHRGVTAFLIPMDRKGLTRGPADRKLGIRASQSCQLFLDE